MAQSNPYNYNNYSQPEQPLIYDADDSIKSGDHLQHLSDGLAGQARTAFIGKVYSLLSLQLFITFSFCLIAQYSQGYRQFQQDNIWMLIVTIVLLLVIMIVAFCVTSAKKTPVAMTLLLFFILCFSYLISFSCSAVVSSLGEDDPVVPIAIAATVGIALALSAYAWLCKGNFLAWMGILLVCCMAALVIGISLIFMRNEKLLMVYLALGVVIYGIYLVILTKLIIGDKMGGFPLDSSIIASVFLYIYIIRMFMYILALVARAKK